MFFRISCHTDTKSCIYSSLQIFFQVYSIIHVGYLFHEVDSIAMPVTLRLKKCFIPWSITPENKYIIDPQEVQIDQCILGFIFAEPTTNKMGYGIHLVVIHNGRTDSHSTRPFSNVNLFKPAIGSLLEHRFTAMVSNVNKGWF